MKYRVAEPVIEFVAAAVGFRRRFLRLAITTPGRAFDANVKVIVVSIHWADFEKP